MNRNELRRLEKAAREKDKTKLLDWASQFESQISSELIKRYEQSYHDQIQCAIDTFLVANWYALHFSEETNLQKSDIASFIEDLLVTVDMFRTGEYTVADYEKILKDDGIVLETYDYDRIFKKFLDTADSELVNFIKGNHRKIITICGSSKYKDIIHEKYKYLTLSGNMVFIDTLYLESDKLDVDTSDSEINDEIHKEKILLSDAVYIVNKDKYIDDKTKSELLYAKEHNKEIIYYENDEIGE